MICWTTAAYRYRSPLPYSVREEAQWDDLGSDAKKVLLVSNDESAFNTLTDQLIFAGFRVQVARSGVECLTRLRHCSPDVLILDPDVPWGGGDGILDAVRLEGLTLDNLIVACNRSNTSLQSFGIPISLHIARPIDVALLIKWLHEHLGAC